MERKLFKSKRIYKYILGCVIQDRKIKRFVLFKKSFSVAFKNIVKEYLFANMFFHEVNKNDINEACFEIMLGRDIDDPLRQIKKINNFIRKVAGNIY